MDTSQFYNFAGSRNSTRVFQDRGVDPEVIKRILRSALESPTSCNRQLWHFVVVTDPERKKRLNRLSHARQSYIYDAPVLIAVFYDCSLEKKNVCKTPYVSSAMATHALLLAAHAEGLGAIYLGGIRKPQGVAKALDAPDYLENVGVVALGYKFDEPPSPPRRSLAETVSYEKCDLAEKHFPADIRPHLWNLRQLADFREKILWYKGIHVDGLTLHANPDPRFSRLFKYMSGRIGMLLAQYKNPRLLDTLSLGGDLVYQIRNSAREEVDRIYAYDLTSSVLDFMNCKFPDLKSDDKVVGLVNEGLDRIKIPLSDNHLDLITCYKRLEQFHSPEALVKEWFRVLKPGGRVFVVLMNRFYPHIYRYKRMHNNYYALGRNWNRGPERMYEPKEARACFEKAGFEVVDLRGLDPLERKGASAIQKISLRCGFHELAKRWDDRMKSAIYENRSRTRCLSRMLVYELEKK